MRTLITAGIMLTLVLSSFGADRRSTKCFDADSDEIFSTAEVISFGESLQTKMPSVEHDQQGKPKNLSWTDCPKNTSVEAERVGVYQRGEIYRITYRTRGESEEPGQVQLECVVFAYRALASAETELRPFFVFTGDDQIASFESYFSSGKDQPFALEIHKSLKGNGVYWSGYTFVFTPTEARILERREGGRRMHTKTYRYDKKGAITGFKAEKEM